MNTLLSTIEKDGWKQTDPDLFQYGRKISEEVYEFKEFDRQMFMDKFHELQKMDNEETNELLLADWNTKDFWIHETISLPDYSEDDIEDHVSGYHEDLAGLKEEYGDDWQWIVAEIIFEQESGLY